MSDEYQNRHFIAVGYFLSRFGERVDERTGEVRSLPPVELDVKNWDQAYDVFFLKLGNGRDLVTFRNSLRNTRDEFDYFLSEVTKRVGHKKKSLPSLRESILQQFSTTTRDDLWAYVSGFTKEFEIQSIQFDLDAMEEANTDSEVTAAEGRERLFISRRRERDPRLRKKAIEIHGVNCKACGFNFGKSYGEWGEGFIEIHHAKPIATYSSEGDETNVDTDLIPLCSNCHRMVHRRKGKLLSLEELSSMLNQNNSDE
jgi:5-methylcytosine-specific restriction protein A